MRIITDQEISRTTAKVYDSWFKISDRLSILDIVVLNNVGSCNDRCSPCRLKELQAELKITKSRISKSIAKWIELGFLIEVNSKTDRRRRFYEPTKLMSKSREIAFNSIREMHIELRQED